MHMDKLNMMLKRSNQPAVLSNCFDAELLDAGGLTVARAGRARCRLRKSYQFARRLDQNRSDG
jgi:hypothetical protein